MKSSVISRERSFLLGLFLFSLFVRVLFFFVFTRYGENYLIHFDSAQYQKLAEQVVDGQGITNDDGTPQFYRLPGYSIFLAGAYNLFGDDHLKALLFQIVLASLIPILIFLLAAMLFPSQILIAKISGLIAAVHVGFVLYAGMIATETLFTLFFLGFFLCLFSCWSTYAAKYIFLAGALLGCASLIRPVGHYVLILTIVMTVVIIYFGRKNAHQTNPKSIIFLSFSWLSIVGWWLARNYVLTGFIFFHTLPGLHFLQYSATKIVMDTEDCSYVQARKQLLEEWGNDIKIREAQTQRHANEYEKCVVGEKLTFKYLKKHPLLAIKHACIEMAKTCCALYSAQIILSDTGKWPDYSKDVSFWSKIKRFLLPDVNHAYLIPIIYWDIILTIMILFGFFGFIVMSLFDATLFGVALKTVPFIGLMVFLTLAYGCARLRLPIEPLLIPLASYFWVFIAKKVREFACNKV